MIDGRARLPGLAAARGVSLAALSRMLGRSHAYLQQWVTRGSPRRLTDRDRQLLADFLGVAESALGGERAAVWQVPQLDIAASAGAGRSVEAETVLGLDAVSAATARSLGLKEGSASIIRVAGDSMAPGLLDGDRLLVDEASRTPDAKGGVYVIRIDDALLVKRVRRAGRRYTATSDNPATPPLPAGEIEVIGRAVWQMRAPR